MGNKLTGENRPRPSNFKVDESQIQRIFEGKEIKQDKIDKEKDERQYIEYVDMIRFIYERIKFILKKIQDKDKSK